MERRFKQHKNKNQIKIIATNVGHQNPRKPTLSLQKRNELTAHVACLLEIGFKQPVSPKEEWQQFVDTHALLSRIMALEATLQRPFGNKTPEQRLANIDEFYKWIKANGGSFDGICLAEFPGFDLGLQATRDIEQNERLFEIPANLILTEDALDEDLNIKKYEAMTNIKLAYALILETLKPNSFWKPYIDLLPEKYSTVLYFTVEDMQQLRGSNVLTQALRQCRAISRQYAFMYKCLQQVGRGDKITPVGNLFREQFSYELYRWAVSTVMTRENIIPRSKDASRAQSAGAVLPYDKVAALIPFWDMANHQHGMVTSFYNVESQQMESDAMMPFKKGDQIFIHYGDRSNADMLVHNGFVDVNNPRDTVPIRLGLSSSDALYEKRMELLRLLSLQKNSELKLLSAPDFISSELLAFVRVFNMNVEQLDHWISSDRATDLLHIDCALETILETKTWQFLNTRLALLLRAFPTTLEADEEELEQLHQCADGDVQCSRIKNLLLQYRVIEKRVLLAALDYVKTRTKA